MHQTYSEGALNLEAYTVNHMGDDGKIEACDVVAFYDWNVTSAGGRTDQIFYSGAANISHVKVTLLHVAM